MKRPSATSRLRYVYLASLFMAVIPTFGSDLVNLEKTGKQAMSFGTQSSLMPPLQLARGSISEIAAYFGTTAADLTTNPTSILNQFLYGDHGHRRRILKTLPVLSGVPPFLSIPKPTA